MWIFEKFSASTKATWWRPAYSQAPLQIKSEIEKKLFFSFWCQAEMRGGQAEESAWCYRVSGLTFHKALTQKYWPPSMFCRIVFCAFLSSGKSEMSNAILVLYSIVQRDSTSKQSNVTTQSRMRASTLLLDKRRLLPIENHSGLKWRRLKLQIMKGDTNQHTSFSDE